MLALTPQGKTRRPVRCRDQAFRKLDAFESVTNGFIVNIEDEIAMCDLRQRMGTIRAAKGASGLGIEIFNPARWVSVPNETPDFPDHPAPLTGHFGAIAEQVLLRLDRAIHLGCAAAGQIPLLGTRRRLPVLRLPAQGQPVDLPGSRMVRIVRHPVFQLLIGRPVSSRVHVTLIQHMAHQNPVFQRRDQLVRGTPVSGFLKGENGLIPLRIQSIDNVVANTRHHRIGIHDTKSRGTRQHLVAASGGGHRPGICRYRRGNAKNRTRDHRHGEPLEPARIRFHSFGHDHAK